MKLVMIGHGMVGHKFIESVLEHAGDTSQGVYVYAKIIADFKPEFSDV